MNRDFSTKTELLSHNLTRILLDTDRYAKSLLLMGDIFPNDIDGVYDRITGDLLIDFRYGGYWIDNYKQKHDINTFDDFDAAKGTVFNHEGRRVVANARAHSRLQVESERPLIFKARDAAVAAVADILQGYHNHIIVSRHIKDIEDAIYMDYIEESPRLKDIYRKFEKEIYEDLADVLNEFQWNELFICKNSNVFMIEVKVDIRIRQWYESKFAKEEEEQERIREHGLEARSIRCT